MASNILTFPAPKPDPAPQPTHPAASLDQSHRLHLCDPTLRGLAQDERASRSLDLAAQVGFTVSHIDRQIRDNTTRERQRRLFVSSSSAACISA